MHGRGNCTAAANRIQAGFRWCVRKSTTKYAGAAIIQPICNLQSVDPQSAIVNPSIGNLQSPLANELLVCTLTPLVVIFRGN